MSAFNNGPGGRKERHRRPVTFLDGARHLPDLTSAQIDRIERHLNRPRPLHARRPIWWPALAVLAIVLVAGAALAVTGSGLAHLPGIGPLFGALFQPSTARRPTPSGPQRRGAGAADVVPPTAETPEPPPPPAARELPPPPPS